MASSSAFFNSHGDHDSGSHLYIFFIIRDKQEIKAWIINSIPSHARRRFTVIGKEIDTAVGGRYLRGMVLISFLVGLMVYLGGCSCSM